MISYIEMQSLMADPNNALLQNSVTDDEYALIVAITYNNTKSIIELLKREPSLHNINFLWFAVTNNNIEPVNIFLNDFAIAEMIKKNGDTEDILMSAIDKKHYGVIDELIKNPILKERLTTSDRIRKYLLNIMSPNKEVGDNNLLNKFVGLFRYWGNFGPLFAVEKWIAYIVEPEAKKSRELLQEQQQQQQQQNQQPYFMQYSSNSPDFLLHYNKITYKFKSLETCLLSLVLIELLCNENGFLKMESLSVINNLNIALDQSSTPKQVEKAVKQLGRNFHTDKIDQYQYNQDVYQKIVDSVDKAVREKIDKENATNQIQKLGRLIFAGIDLLKNQGSKPLDKQEFIKFFTSLQKDFKMTRNAQDYRKNIGVKEVVVEGNVKANNAFSIRNTIQKNRKAAEEQSRKEEAERVAAKEQSRKEEAERIAAAEQMAAKEQSLKEEAERIAAEEQALNSTDERKTTPTTSQQDDTSTSNVASSPVVNESLWQKIKNFFKYIFNSFASVFFGEQPEVKVVVDRKAIERLKNYIKERLRGDTSKDDELENILEEKNEYELLLKVKRYVDGHPPPLKFSEEKSPNMDDLDKELKQCLHKNNII